MFNKKLEPLSALGMIITTNQAISLGSIAVVTHVEDGYDIELTNGSKIQLSGQNAIEFDAQLEAISQGIRAAQFAASPRMIKGPH